jgi:hypothetical protein
LLKPVKRDLFSLENIPFKHGATHSIELPFTFQHLPSMKKSTVLTITLTTLLWALVIIGFQWVTNTRFTLFPPDTAVFWSATETQPYSNAGKIYLLEPFMNRQVAWDSEYYVGIAASGYDDPAAGAVRNPKTGRMVIKNYSFFPFYPYVMRVFAWPLGLFGLNPIAAASLAGVIVAVLGTIAGLIALYDLTRPYFDDESSLRTVFYALVFPTSFFFAMVYTEGLFIGLAFGAIALAKRKHWLLASILALFAAWTRAHGAALALPLLVIWLAEIKWREPLNGKGESEIRPSWRPSWKWFAQGALALLPVAGYLIWRFSPLGEGWAELQSFYFGRGLMTIERSLEAWKDAIFYGLYQGKGAGLIYLWIDLGAIALALVSSIWLLRRDLPLALFSLAVVLLSVFSGATNSMARYMIITPALFIFLAQLGRNKVFDRAWTVASILLLGMEAMLFAVDFWVG